MHNRQKNSWFEEKYINDEVQVELRRSGGIVPRITCMGRFSGAEEWQSD
jgi:hypothetical protein